jgi:phosphoglycolate phosphatase
MMAGGTAVTPVAPRLVVFDLDGTLVDSLRDLAAAVNDTLAAVAPGQGPLPVDEVRGFVGEGARVLLERSLRRAGVERPADAVMPLFLERYRARLTETTRLYPGAREALDRLSGKAVLAVLTNKPSEMSRVLLAALGVDGRFARIWGPGDVPARKPDPSGLLALMSLFDATPAGTVMVGDSAVDVRTARAAGVRAVGVTFGLHPESLRAERPDLLVDDLRELPVLLFPPEPPPAEPSAPNPRI